ncbi:MAG TPA: FkbM family methyltransferase [Bacteroidia bacterium]|nr:FkbM family methyltransferase [Bacteroidia bacterium]
MKNVLKALFRMLGLEVRRSGTPAVQPQVARTKRDEDSMEAGMSRAKKMHGVEPSAIIDLGAAAGSWTEKACTFWPDAYFLLMEPLEERKEELSALAAAHPKFRTVFAAAGDRVGKVKFVVAGDLDGSGVYDAESTGGDREVELTTIDHEVERLGLAGPFVIKFDTHGFEIPILEGARETLKKTDLIIMECYGFRIAANCLLFPEMCIHMEKLGFRLSDVIHPVRRPGDGMFWQCDAFFLRKDHPAFAKNTFA